MKSPVYSQVMTPTVWGSIRQSVILPALLRWLADHGQWGIFLGRSLLGIFIPPWKWRATLNEIRLIGVDSLSIIVFTGFFTGMVLGLQGYHTLKRFSSEGLLGSGVVLSLLRELGPVLSALLLTGRAGSAMCAQVGVMRISEQIDALECMAIDVFNYLISPKMLAGIICLPILTLIFCVVGVYGGYIASCVIIGINPSSYYQGMVEALSTENLDSFQMCLCKAFVFSILVVSICTYQGYCVLKLRAKGAAGVSKATTKAVVFSSVSILLWDYLITSFMM